MALPPTACVEVAPNVHCMNSVIQIGLGARILESHLQISL